MRCLIGVESELALIAGRDRRHENGFEGRRLEAVARIIGLARQELECLPAVDTGLFLATGGRLYAEGAFVEYGSPECQDPFTAVAAVRAGERVCRGLVDRLNERYPGDDWEIFATNVDYIGRVSYGAHENYSYQGKLEHLAHHLLSFFVSRVVFTGSGGFDYRDRCRFVLSPRALFFTQASSHGTTGDRGIFNTRMEDLALNSKRLHVICGEALRSDRALLLRLGATALVVTLIDRGLLDAGPVKLREPVAAFHTVAEDQTCRQEVELAGGRCMSALGIQRFYLEAAQRCMADGREDLPAWAGAVVGLWEETLGLLEGGNARAAGLDWALRRDFLESWCRKGGAALADLAAMAPMIQFMDERAEHNLCDAQEAGRMLGRPAVTERNWLGMPRKKPAGGEEERKASELIGLRNELLALDIRFSQLGGVFDQLDVDLNQHASGVSDERIRELMTQGPPGRAACRSRWIRRLSPRSRRAEVDAAVGWTAIVDRTENRMLDLSDAWTDSMPQWCASLPRAESDLVGDEIGRLLEEVRDHYHRGRYEAALALLDTLSPLIPRLGNHRDRVPRFRGWCKARMGDRPAALEALLRLGPAGDGAVAEERAMVYRFGGLEPVQREMGEAVGQMVRHAGQAQAVSAFGKEMLGIHAMREHPEEAMEWLSEAARTCSEPRIRARILAPMADLHRRRGDVRAALDMLREATAIQRGTYFGDYAEYTLTTLAKSDPEARAGALEAAMAVQRRYNHPVGLTRTQLLMIRGCDDPCRAGRVRRRVLGLVRRCPSLQACRLCGLILGAGWEAWVTGKEGPAGDDGGDDFWGV